MDKDEDLLLFREIHKREKERIASLLLQPVSDEFEPNYYGNFAVYRIASTKKVSGYEFVAGGIKNDYDWLKTPPATPLFPSLEMEANAAPLHLHREIPILQPHSRLSSNTNPEASKEDINRTSVSPKPKVRPRSTTTKNLQELVFNQKRGIDNPNRPSKMSNQLRATVQQESNPNFLTANAKDSRKMGTESKIKPTTTWSRGFSPPVVRTKIGPQIPGFSDETPPNLRRDGSSSVSRCRCSSSNTQFPKPDSTGKPRRQSCSPRMASNRKVQLECNKLESEGKSTTQTLASRAQVVVGSRIVDKVMNARKSGAETKPNLRGDQTPAYCRMATKGPILDMAIKRMEIKREQINSSHSSLARRCKSSMQ